MTHLPGLTPELPIQVIYMSPLHVVVGSAVA